jgi:hypothetical protein
MAKPDSVRFKREAQQCELASKIATFLESYVPRSYYDFSLPDLLYFSSEEALLELRQNTVWQALEREFVAAGGLVSEDWDDAVDESITPHPVKVPTDKRSPKNRAIGLIIVTFAVSAFIGGLIGWNYPYFRFPVLSKQATTTVK